MADNMMKGTIPVYCLSKADKAALARIYKGTVPNDAETTGKQQVAEDHEEDGITLLKEISAQLTIEQLPEIFSKVEAIVKEKNMTIPAKPEQWIFDALDHEDKIRVIKEWISKATENQDPTGGVEMDLAAEALNWLRMGQIVGIIVIGAESDEDESATEEVLAPTPAEEQAPTPSEDQTLVSAPVEEQTVEPAEVPSEEQTQESEPTDLSCPELDPRNQYLQPNPGIIDFRCKAIERLNEIMGQLVDEVDFAKQGKLLEEIVALAFTNQLSTLAEVAENCVRRMQTVTDVIDAISIALEALATAERYKRLQNAFEAFCEENHTTPKEMREIISD